MKALILANVCAFLFAASAALASNAPIDSSEEASFVEQTAQSISPGLRISVWRASVGFSTKEQWDGSESKTPVLVGPPAFLNLDKYPDAPLLGVFIENRRSDRSCHIVVVEENLAATMRRIVDPLVAAGFGRALAYKAMLVHEIAHCIEYQNAFEGRSTSSVLDTSREVLTGVGTATTEQTLHKESFADSLAAAWAERQHGGAGFAKALAAVRKARPSDADHATWPALFLLAESKALGTDNLCELANSVRDPNPATTAFPSCK